MRRNITLVGQEVAYTLIRRNRKTIGLIVNRAGLIVRVPLHATSGSIEQVLHQTAWVISKLDGWKEETIYPVWKPDSQFWLLRALSVGVGCTEQPADDPP